MAQVLARHMELEGHAVVMVADGEKGIEEFRRQKVDLVLTDLKLPGKSGLEVLQAVKDENPMVPIVVMTAHGTIETAVKAVKEGAFDFLQKPVDPDHLLIIIGKALEARHLVTENLILKEELSQTKYAKMVGQSRALLEAQDKAKKVAVGTTTVLLLGESGTGKELFARMIHDLSPRKNGPFVAINCAAIPRALLESELFGHERGSFTGATGRKIGKFEVGDRATVYPDEIADTDIALQAKLLRVPEGESVLRSAEEGVPAGGSLQEASSAASRAVEAKMIEKVLRETGGNKTKAAEILQVSYKTLLTKIKDYGLDKE